MLMRVTGRLGREMTGVDAGPGGWKLRGAQRPNRLGPSCAWSWSFALRPVVATAAAAAAVSVSVSVSVSGEDWRGAGVVD